LPYRFNPAVDVIPKSPVCASRQVAYEAANTANATSVVAVMITRRRSGPSAVSSSHRATGAMSTSPTGRTVPPTANSAPAAAAHAAPSSSARTPA
jgi:hypothetical protein